MDTSVLDFYDPYVPKKPVVLDERKVKDDAFYTASSVAPPEDVEQVYDQILSDVIGLVVLLLLTNSRSTTRLLNVNVLRLMYLISF
jgi:hypothetical protein